MPGEPARGYLVALGSRAAQEEFDTDRPVFGRLTARMLAGDQEGDQRRAEPAIAFVLGRRLAGPGVTVADAVGAVDFVLPAIVLADPDPGRGVDGLVADDLGCRRVVLGGEPTSPREVGLRLAGCVFYRNGEVVRTSVGGVVLGSPVRAVAWLAGTGTAVEAGQLVVVSSLTAPVEVKTGDWTSVTIAGLGAVSATVR